MPSTTINLKSFLLLAPLLAGCAAPTKPTPPVAKVAQSAAFPTDDLGRVVALKAPARRVITLAPGATETVFALGAQAQLVGRDQISDFPAAAKKLPVAGDYQGPNIEQTIALRPDLVIVQGETLDKTRVEAWQNKIGAPVAALSAHTLSQVRAGIEKIGAWTGTADKAKILAQTLDFPKPNPSAAPDKATVFIEIDPTSLYTAGAGTLVSDVVETSGLRNVAKIKGYAPYNIESLLADAPDFYLSPTTKTKADKMRELQSSPTLSKLKCVQAGRVIVINEDLILRPGPRLRQGVLELQLEDAKMRIPKTVTHTINGQ